MRDRSSMPPPPQYNVELAEFFPLSLGSGPLLSTLYLGEGVLGTRSIAYHAPLLIMFFILAKFFPPTAGIHMNNVRCRFA